MTAPVIAGAAVRRGLGVVCILAALAVVAAFCSLPLLYPSSSILYKFGLDKTLLNAGKLCGAAALALLLLQVALAARLRLLDRVVSQDRQTVLHRWVGAAVLALVAAHPLLVFAPEDVTTIPLDLEYWPEVLGAGALISLAFMASVTWIRDAERLPHQWWRTAHRLGALVVVGAVVVHVLYVTDTYGGGPPRWAILAGAALAGLGWLRVAARWLLRPQPHTITRVFPAGRDAYAVELTPESGVPLRHAPGQFAFFCLAGQTLPPDEHPFTISSAPGQPLQLTIRCAGDWTSRAGLLQEGRRVYLQGPYGQFTHLLWPQAERLVMIAGGIGVTPMLSMLRHMAQEGRGPETHLIWTNRTSADIAHADEVADLCRRCAWLQMTHMLSREEVAGGDGVVAGRLHRDELRRLAGDWRDGTLAFVCGPPRMMAEVRGHLRGIGYPRRAIVLEEFNL